VKFLCQWLLDNCLEDMKLMADKVDPGCIDRLNMVASTPFIRLTYTEAVEILEESGKKFENEVKWGIDLASEHERYFYSFFKFLFLLYCVFSLLINVGCYFCECVELNHGPCCSALCNHQASLSLLLLSCVV